ncbi:MAG: lipid-A-disaccharide synthase [Alteromonadaceae bacterium]|jgi:lipid-A-disaccharide synthase
MSQLTIGIVVGEHSGDILGSGLIKALKQQHPEAKLVGIGGPLMLEEGFNSLFAMEELSVMGLVEVLGRLRRLLSVRKQLVEYFVANPPDVFIGIDAPDFNLGLELRLKNQGIKTIHYVSPSIWAWREKRVFKVAAATDLVLCLLPFEQQFYQKYDVPSQFVGHTLADEIPLQTDKHQARINLGIDPDCQVVALMPGSRGSELNMLAAPFLQAALKLKANHPKLIFVVPMVNQKRKEQLLAIKQMVAPDLALTILDGQSREAMAASDAIMMASGTATLEGTLIKRPMVVAYKFKWLSYQIFIRLIKVKSYSLPNLLAGKVIVPEVIQDKVVPNYLAQLIEGYLGSDNHELMVEFERIHLLLRLDASKHAAQAVLGVIEGNANTGKNT